MTFTLRFPRKLKLSSVYGKIEGTLPLRCCTCAAVIRTPKAHEILGKFTQFAKVQCSKCRKLPNPI